MSFRTSSYTAHKHWEGKHRFEHWYRDNSVYFRLCLRLHPRKPSNTSVISPTPPVFSKHVFLPILLIVLAGLTASGVAYGTDPGWGQYSHGLNVILWTRSLQWPLVALALLSCISLIALCISGRRRAWWLVGLLPVLLLFIHRFAADPSKRMNVIDGPTFAEVDAQANGVQDEDWIVGLKLGDSAYAYPYVSLFYTPVVLQADREKRIVLMWSAYANRALALPITQELRGRDLEVVSMPANALLLYNSRTGQFINGLTGETPKFERPTGFAAEEPIATWKMTWKGWRTLHPNSKYMIATIPQSPAALRQPMRPIYPMPPMKLDRPGDSRVSLIGSAKPMAFETNKLTAAPLNGDADGVPVVVFREKKNHPIHAYDRRSLDARGKLDLILHFVPNLSHKQQSFLIDTGSNTGWSADGICMDVSPETKLMKGHRLTPMAVDEDLPWDVIKYWYPDLALDIPPAAPIKVEAEGSGDAPSTATTRPRAKKKKPKTTTTNPPVQ